MLDLEDASGDDADVTSEPACAGRMSPNELFNDPLHLLK
jgi:hypothetical protein